MFFLNFIKCFVKAKLTGNLDTHGVGSYPSNHR
jgi:hypothetical protein